WGGQAEPGVTDRPAETPPTSTPGVLTPIVCELSSTTKWSRIERLHGANTHGARLPDVNEIMRGRSVWAVRTSDPARGDVSAISATLPESGEGDPKIVTRKLLAARGGSSARHSATAISRQMEGYAAVRVSFSVEKNGEIKPRTPMRNLSVAWENYMDG